MIARFIQSLRHAPPIFWLGMGIYFIRQVFADRGASGEYTDGILQLNVFQTDAGLYPPLYGALALLWHKLPYMGNDLEQSARYISNLAAVVSMSMVYRLGDRLGGQRAAWLAALLFAVSPMPWRWSVRVMTDSLYMAVSTGALYCLTEAWMKLRSSEAADKGPTAARSLAWAVLLGALATLTRYQGVLLAPLLALVFALYIKRYKSVPWGALAAGVTWLAVPAWMYINGFVHQQQFSSRTALTPMATIGAWWNTLESFVLVSPYYMGYPVFAAALAGLFYIRGVSKWFYARPAAVLWGSYAVLLLGLQAAFGSFQYRYMMPLLPMVVALAGCGFAGFEDRFARFGWLPRWAFVLSMIYLGFFTASIMFLQSGKAFSDQRQAAAFITKHVPPATKVYSNERYGNFTRLGAVKLSYWSGRPVETLVSPQQPIEPGSILVLGTAYGGNEGVSEMMAALSSRYRLEPMPNSRFDSRLLPLMDDIMVNPLFNQNPMGWVMRYVPQDFATQIFRVNVLPAGAATNAR